MVSSPELFLRLNADLFFTQVAPDEPYFIHSTLPYRKAYRQFVAEKFYGSDFYLSPQPTGLNQILLNARKIDMFMRSSIVGSPEDFRVTPVTILQRPEGEPGADMAPNNFLAPILWSYNNSMPASVLVGDHPKMLYINYLAKSLPLATVQGIIGRTMTAYQRHTAFKLAVRDSEAELNQRRVEYIRCMLHEASNYEKIVALVGGVTRDAAGGAAGRGHGGRAAGGPLDQQSDRRVPGGPGRRHHE